MNALQVETCMLYMYFKETSLISHASLESSNKESINQKIHVWQVSLQLSCGNTCQIWTWYTIANMYYGDVKKLGK